MSYLDHMHWPLSFYFHTSVIAVVLRHLPISAEQMRITEQCSCRFPSHIQFSNSSRHLHGPTLLYYTLQFTVLSDPSLPPLATPHNISLVFFSCGTYDILTMHTYTPLRVRLGATVFQRVFGFLTTLLTHGSRKGSKERKKRNTRISTPQPTSRTIRSQLINAFVLVANHLISTRFSVETRILYTSMLLSLISLLLSNLSLPFSLNWVIHCWCLRLSPVGLMSLSKRSCEEVV